MWDLLLRGNRDCLITFHLMWLLELLKMTPLTLFSQKSPNIQAANHVINICGSYCWSLHHVSLPPFGSSLVQSALLWRKVGDKDFLVYLISPHFYLVTCVAWKGRNNITVSKANCFIHMRLKQLGNAFSLLLNITFLSPAPVKRHANTNQRRSSVVCGEVAPLAFGKSERPVAVLAAHASG